MAGRRRAPLVAPLVVLLAAAAAASSSSSGDDEIQRQQRRAEAHLERGNGYYASGQLDRAKVEYESCINVVTADDANEEEEPRPPPPPQGCLINLGSVLVDMGTDVQRAEQLYRRALSYDPSDGDASYNLAVLLHDRKRDETAVREASELYSVAVKSDPNRWDAWANMASALTELRERPLKAVYAYERSILLLEGGEEEEGERDAEVNAYLSTLYYGYGLQLADLTGEACLTLARAPQSLLIGKERVVADMDDAAEEGTEADESQADAEEEATAKEAAAAAIAKDLCTENARNALRAASTLDTNNVQASHMLAAIESEMGTKNNNGDDSGDGADAGGGSVGGVRRAAPEFVSALFDDFADTFDEKLGALGYKVPRLIGAAAAEVLMLMSSSAQPPREGKKKKKYYTSALDAGCGTGLAGRYLRPLVDGPLIGVDVSKKMLDVAERCTVTSGCGMEEDDDDDEEAEGTAKNDDATDAAAGDASSEDDDDDAPLYDGLMALDLETMTLEQTLGAPGVARRRRRQSAGDEEGGIAGVGEQAFDLIVAADVLVYFGDLARVLANFGRLSSEGSALIFSCERTSIDDDAPQGWKLMPSGRFAHTKSYVVETANDAGYGHLAGYDEIVPRMENGMEVQGHLFRFVKGGGGIGAGGDEGGGSGSSSDGDDGTKMSEKGGGGGAKKKEEL